MHNIFSINGTGILTLKDLQREFSPWDIYDSLSDFAAFASIHSKPLPLKVYHQEDGELVVKDAKCFNKSFWLDVLKISRWPKEPNPINLIKMLAEEALLVSVGAKEKFAEDDKIGLDKDNKKNQCISYESEKETVIAEYNLLHIEKKIGHIVKTAKQNEFIKEARTAIVLLAICEISEINALDFCFSRSIMQNASKPADVKNTVTSAEIKGVIKKQIIPQNKADDTVAEFPSTNEISLVTSDTPYKYWYHSSNKLKAGETIKTVCLYAKPSSNRYANVIIQLYDDATKKYLHTLTLAADEHRYCNVAGGKIIKFLPTIAMSKDACLYRNNLTKPHITVCTECTGEWTLDGDNVSSFGIAGGDDGFVLVQKGNLNTVFYKKANDYMTKLMMNLIVDPVVEIKLTEDGYAVLTSTGEVISDIPSFKAEYSAVSLDDFSRLPIAKSNLCKDDELEEISLGNKRDCLMIRSRSKEKNIILFSSQKKRINAIGDTTKGIKVLVE